MNRLNRIILNYKSKHPAYEVLGAIMIETIDTEQGIKWQTRADVGKLDDSKPIRVKKSFETLEDAQRFGEKLYKSYPSQDELYNKPMFIIDDI